MRLQKDLREFVELLNSHRVEYLVVGGHAVAGNLDGIPVRFPDLSTLVNNKKASGRTKDLADVEGLENVTKHR